MKRNLVLFFSIIAITVFAQLKDFSLIVSPKESPSVQKLVSHIKHNLESMGYRVNLFIENSHDEPTAEFLIEFKQGEETEYSVYTRYFRNSSKIKTLQNLATLLYRGLSHTGLRQGTLSNFELDPLIGAKGPYRKIVVNLGNLSSSANAQYYQNETNLENLAKILADQLKLGYHK